MTRSLATSMLAALAFLLSGPSSCGGGDSAAIDGPVPTAADGGGHLDGALPGDAGGTGAGALPDPCTLLAPEEWAPLMEGTPVVEPRSGSAGGVGLTRCDWTYNENGAATGIRRQWSNISISVAGAYGPTPGSQPVDLGDAGYLLATDLARTIDIGWKRGTAAATFKYSALVLPAGKAWPELRDAAIALASQAASRMP